MNTPKAVGPSVTVKAFLTIITEQGSTREKLHTTIGNAKNAFSFSPYRQGTLWKWNYDTETWDKLFTVGARTQHTVTSGLPWNEGK